MNKIISLFTAACLLVSAANAQEEKKVVIVKKMDTTIVHGKDSGPQKMTVIVENGKVTINGKPVDGANLPELMGSVPGIPKVMMFKSDDMNAPLPKLDGKVGELKIVKGMPLDMSKMGENFGQFLFDDHFSESILKKLKDGTLEDKIIINVDEFGEIDSYDTETDMIVLLPN